MALQSPTRTITIPEGFFARLQNVARHTHRSVEDILVTSIDVALPLEPALPEELASELAAMMLFKDEQLWAATESSLSAAQQRRLQQLTDVADERALTAAEEAELQELLDHYDRAILRRARAMTILAQRGYDVLEKVEATNDGEDL
jgi:hypothetical protein